MFLTQNKKLGFIHIPKTGGVSVTQLFKDTNNLITVDKQHATFNEYVNKNTLVYYPKYWFATVRHPAARAQSYYYYFIEHDLLRITGYDRIKANMSVDFLHKRIHILVKHGIKKFLLRDRELVEEYNYWHNYFEFRDNKKYQNMWHLRKLSLKSNFKFIRNCPNIRFFDLSYQANDLNDWLYNFGIKDKIPKKNVTLIKPDRHWKDEFDDDLLESISIHYKDDFEFFNYKI